MSRRTTNQRIAKAFYTSFEVNNLFSLLKQLGFYLDDTTANDLDWVFKHKYRTPKNGKDYITLPRFTVYTERLSLIIIDQIKRFNFSEQDIIEAAKK